MPLSTQGEPLVLTAVRELAAVPRIASLLKPPVRHPAIGASPFRHGSADIVSLSFRAVNRRDAPDFDAGLQRHHILPRQLLSQRCFGSMFERIGRARVGFDDFRSNGLLLPASDAAALRLGLPLHRGPHRSYNAMVIERVGQVEESWSRTRLRAPEIALEEALLRLGLLQRALRRRLLARAGRPLSLNRHDPQGRPVDYSELDAMADALWGALDRPD